MKLKAFLKQIIFFHLMFIVVETFYPQKTLFKDKLFQP